MLMLHAISFKNIENLQTRALRYFYKVYNASYKGLSLKSYLSSLRLKCPRKFGIEIFKTLKNTLNPNCTKEMFILRQSGRLVQEKYK